MRKAIVTFIIAFIVSGVSSLHAQVDAVGEVSARASRLIDSTMASLNLRANRFNEELSKVNVLKPLDVASMTKEIIPGNKEKIKDFLNYLEVYRTLSDRQAADIEDSVKKIRSGMPSKLQSAFMKEFMEAYTLDQTAFNKYTLALTKVFTKVTEILTFVENSKVKVENNKLQFNDKEEYEAYSKLITEIEKLNKKLATAGANSQTATIDAGSMMQKAYGGIKK